MRKGGFTITELIVTLGIVGVISALMIPMLSENVNKTKNAAILSKVVAQFESATAEYLVQERANKLSQTIEGFIFYTNMFDIDKGFGKFLGAATGQNSNWSADINNYSKSQPYHLNNVAKYSFSKLPAEYVIELYPHNGNNYTPGTDDIRFYKVYIDVNGFGNKPDCFGKDVFMFYLLDNGKMMPYGDLNGSDNDEKYTDTCNAIGLSRSDAKAGMSCAARVVADGYKITY